MNCVARWRAKGEHKGKVRIHQVVSDFQLWRVEIKVSYRDERKTRDEHIISPKEPCTLRDIQEIAFESVHELLHVPGKAVHDADMKFFVMPIKNSGRDGIL